MRRYVKPKIIDPDSPKSRTLEDCSICLGHLKLFTATSCDRILELKACSHYFHESCLTTWLESKSECPLCRTSIFSWHFSIIKHCNITNFIPNVALTLNQTFKALKNCFGPENKQSILSLRWTVISSADKIRSWGKRLELQLMFVVRGDGEIVFRFFSASF